MSSAHHSTLSLSNAPPASGAQSFRSKYAFGNNHSSVPKQITGGTEPMSYGKNRTPVCAHTDDLKADPRFTDAVRRLPVKYISVAGVLSESTVESWRRGQNPRFDKAMFAGQRVKEIQDAILDILLADNPERRAAFRHVPQLLSSLAEIAGGKDEIARTIALRALKKFGSEP